MDLSINAVCCLHDRLRLEITALVRLAVKVPHPDHLCTHHIDRSFTMEAPKVSSGLKLVCGYVDVDTSIYI
jgi:hypothetical protein